MKKGKVARVAGFVGALGVSAVLVTTAVQGTGAYFTSSVDGSLNGSTGQLVVRAQSTTLNFTNLVPGTDQHRTVTFNTSANSSTNADIWLVFDQTTAGYGAFTGAKDPSGTAYDGVVGGGLGQYGHFAVTGQSGLGFESYNLQLPTIADAMNAYTSSTSANTCRVDGNGDGGSTAQHAINQGTDIAECGAPAAILLWKNLAPGVMGASATITFGVTGKWSSQGKPAVSVGFKIVATQRGQYPLIKTGAGAGTIGTNW